MMLRGAIDQVTDGLVSGWLYSDLGTTRDRTVLAFLDQQCVGAGKVDQFRPDLAEAGLADGMLGFRFGIRLDTPEDAARVTVRLEGSDALLLQSRTRVQPAELEAATKSSAALPRRSESSLAWMLARGWLSQPEHDFLKFFGRLGVYDRALRLPKRGGEPASRLDPEVTAREIFEVLAMDEVQLSRRPVGSADALPAALAEVREDAGSLPLIALWSEGRGRLGVVEGSQLMSADTTPSREDTWADYALGPDHLVFVDPRCRLQVRGEDVPGLTLFSGRAGR